MLFGNFRCTGSIDLLEGLVIMASIKKLDTQVMLKYPYNTTDNNCFKNV